jgi:hypothetical protein
VIILLLLLALLLGVGGWLYPRGEIQIRHLRCPSCVRPDSSMPSFAALGPVKLRELSIFLEASKGRR